MYIDGHLDLAMNAQVLGYDLRQPLNQLRQHTPELVVSLPALQDAQVGIVFATLFVLSADAYRPPEPAHAPASLPLPVYHDAAQAHAQAWAQLETYQRWEDQGAVRILRNRRELSAHQQQWQHDKVPGLVILMEGADPIRRPEELAQWWQAGVRMVGLAWQATRYAGGTHQPGGLTPLGRELLAAMDACGMPLDVSHLAEASFWQALEVFEGVVLASHSNARAITPTDRHLNDAMVQALAERDAVVGMVIANRFLRGDRHKTSPKAMTTLADVGAQAQHLASMLGWQGVAIGSDFDGGFGRADIPAELDSMHDFAKLGDCLPAAHRADVLGANWLRLLARALPA